MKVALIIPAAGIGKRFSANEKKQFYEINNKPILFYTIKRLLESYDFHELIIGINDEDSIAINNIIADLKSDPKVGQKINSNLIIKTAKGGKERVNTVFNCINQSESDFVAVHDAVRPFVNTTVIQNVIHAGINHNGAICGLPVRDTVKKVNNNNDLIDILETIPRDNLYLAHTPQVFNKSMLIKAMEESINKNIPITDEASAFEYFYSQNKDESYKVQIVLSNYDNIKVTYAEDKELIHAFFHKYFGE